MPAPPKKGETKEKFMSRCIVTFIREGREPNQAKSICHNMWSKKHSNSGDEIKDDNEAIKKFIEENQPEDDSIVRDVEVLRKLKEGEDAGTDSEDKV